MKCSKCGVEYDIMYGCCPNCGEVAVPQQVVAEVRHDIPPVEEVKVNPGQEKLLALLKDKLFLLICIFLTVSCALSITGGAIPVFPTLIAIFMWILYAGARKGVIKQGQIQAIRTTIRVEYILNNVLNIILILTGIATCLVMVVAAGAFEAFIIAITDFLEEELGFPVIISHLSTTMHLLIGGITSLGTTLTGIYGLVVSLLFLRKANNFVKAVQKNVETNNSNYAFALSAKKWIFAYGIYRILDVIISATPQVLIGDALLFASIIIGSVLIGKYLVPKN